MFTEPLLSDIIIIKNAEGLAFLPEYDYNGIGDFEPGLGYQIKVDSTQTFYYLENWQIILLSDTRPIDSVIVVLNKGLWLIWDLFDKTNYR